MEKIDREAARIAYDFFTNNNPSALKNKMNGLSKPPKNLDLFGYMLISFCQTRSPNIKSSTPGFFEHIIPKKNIENILDYFENGNCLCIKVCFGLNDHYHPVAVISGSFVVNTSSPTVTQIDNYYTDDNNDGVYFLNFDERITPAIAGAYIASFQKQAALSDLHGYVLDIATYRRFLTDETLLGRAAKIRLRFGMNHDGDPSSEGGVSGHAQTMMLELSDFQDNSHKSLYLCESSIKNDSDPDPTGCPPRQPCNVSKKTTSSN